jgi:hypothetical protein
MPSFPLSRTPLHRTAHNERNSTPWPPNLRSTPIAKNAKASTGPSTEEGKAKSSRNNTKFGLSAINNCVQLEEQEDCENFCRALWTTLAPADPVDTMI